MRIILLITVIKFNLTVLVVNYITNKNLKLNNKLRDLDQNYNFKIDFNVTYYTK
jgi:hypothetical protein